MLFRSDFVFLRKGIFVADAGLRGNSAPLRESFGQVIGFLAGRDIFSGIFLISYIFLLYSFLYRHLFQLYKTGNGETFSPFPVLLYRKCSLTVKFCTFIFLNNYIYALTCSYTPWPSSLYFSRSFTAGPDSPNTSCTPIFSTGVGAFSHSKIGRAHV